jgi:uncharacterized damage-inducible protein DinB
LKFQLKTRNKNQKQETRNKKQQTMQTNASYPIGKYEVQPFSEQKKIELLADIRFLPSQLEAAVLNFDENQFKTPYREGGWTVHQLVHHVADSHMNAYIRFKLGYTEDNPTIRTYEQDLWAKTTDVENLPVNISLTLLHALHQRWYEFLKHFTDAAWNRTIFHPERKKDMTLWELLGLYAWHGRHHTAHITALKERKKWK